MNDVRELRAAAPANPDLPPVLGPDTQQTATETARSRSGAGKVGVAALVILAAALGYGAGPHAWHDVGAGAVGEGQRGFVPPLRPARVRPPPADVVATLPATTSAFEAANVFARASGYIAQ